MGMELIPLITVPALFLAIALLKPHVQPRVPWGICAMCGSVFGTWLLLGALWLAGAAVPPLAIGILMGMSVSGLIYKLEPVYERHHVRNFWFVRVAIVLAGYAAVYLGLTRQWDILVPVAIFGSLTVLVATFLFQGVTHEDVLAEAGAGERRGLLKRLDDCC